MFPLEKIRYKKIQTTKRKRLRPWSALCAPMHPYELRKTIGEPYGEKLEKVILLAFKCMNL